MKNLYGILFTLIGLFLVGIGAYIGFENYDVIFYSKERESLYNGVYFASGDIVNVLEEDDKTLEVVINQEPYLFTWNGEYFVNKENGFYVKFKNEMLTIYKDGEEIKTLKRKYKNSIHN